jgi:glucose-1-phosphate cytidylyltransferase
MKAVILAGGYGTRISEESMIRPKPMIEIGNRPILWHIMKIYSANGINDFIICCGYKGHMIKDYFANYHAYSSDVTYDFRNSQTTIHRNDAEPWRITCIETGEGTLTGGRLKRAGDHLDGDTFCMTYGDGVCDLNISNCIELHRQENALCTLTAVQPPGRFGAFTLTGGKANISQFHEKPLGDGSWINGGFFVMEPEVIDYIDGDQTSWESEPMKKLANEDKLFAYKHDGFWQSMDTLRDKMVLEEVWARGDAPWKLWES